MGAKLFYGRREFVASVQRITTSGQTSLVTELWPIVFDYSRGQTRVLTIDEAEFVELTGKPFKVGGTGCVDVVQLSHPVRFDPNPLRLSGRETQQIRSVVVYRDRLFATRDRDTDQEKLLRATSVSLVCAEQSLL